MRGRLAFWSDAVDAITSIPHHASKSENVGGDCTSRTTMGVPQHPVARALLESYLAAPIPWGRMWLRRIVDGHCRLVLGDESFDYKQPEEAQIHSIDDVAMDSSCAAHDASRPLPARRITTLHDLTTLTQHTHASALTLILASAGHQSPDMDHIVAHLGAAQGMAYLLSRVAADAQRRMFYLPLAIAEKYSVVEEDVFRRGPGAEGLRELVWEVYGAASEHLDIVRSLLKDHEATVARAGTGEAGRVPLVALSAAVPTARLLEQIRRVQFDVFDRRVVAWDSRPADWLLPWRMWLAQRRRRI